MIDDKQFCVYIHELPDGRKYIGCTCENPFVRFKNGEGYVSNRSFYNEIVKVGWDNISHVVVASGLTLKEACHIEIELIREFNTTSPKYGFNIDEGGRHKGWTKKSVDKSSYGRNLEKLLLHYGFSVSEFSDISNLDEKDIEAYISCEKIPDVYTAGYIAKLLHTTVSKMIYM